MNVTQIVDIIKRQSLMGNTGFADDNVKIVQYLNMAYRKVYDGVVREYPFLVATVQTVAVTAGSGTLSVSPFFILSVRDTGSSSQPLTPMNVEAIQETDNALNAVGSPSYWFMEGFSTLKSYPMNDTSLAVRYVPNAAVLTMDSAEGDIMLPPMFHDVLVWETLKVVAYDERDKMTGAEIVFVERMADEVGARLSSFLANRTGQQPTRTRGVLA